METGNIKAKKSLGQHWLIDIPTLDDIVELADLKQSDVVLEIGPGTGNLTKLIAPKVKKLIAIELDRSLIDGLNKMQIPNLEVINQDILTFDLTKLPKGYKLVANIPYYLTSKLIRTLSESTNPPEKAILLVQKEIADRITATPPNMSILSLTAQYYWDVSSDIFVPSYMFDPPPKVDSAVISMIRKNELALSTEETAKLFKIIKISFASKRKTILNNLSVGLKLPKEEVEEKLKSIDIDPSIRAQNLNMEQWNSLYTMFA